MKKCKVQLEAAKKKWNEKEAEEASLKLEISELKKSIEESLDQIRVTKEAIEGEKQFFWVYFAVFECCYHLNNDLFCPVIESESYELVQQTQSRGPNK